MRNLVSEKETLLLYTLSGLLLGCALIFPSFSVCVIGGALLFMVAVAKSRSTEVVLVGGLVAFIGKMLLATSYILSVYPVEGIGIELGSFEIPVILYYWVTSAASIGIVGGIFAPVIRYVYVTSRRLFLFLLPPLWVAAEVLGSFTYSFFMYGEGSRLNISNTGGYVGYAFAEHQGLLSLAQFGGVYLLSLLVIIFALVVWSLRERLSVTLMFGLGLAVSVAFGLSKDVQWGDRAVPPRGLTVTVIDTKFGGSDYYHTYTDEERARIKETALNEALALALSKPTTYVIMPEDSLLHSSQVSAEVAYEQFWLSYGAPRTVVVSAGVVKSAAGGNVVRATVFDGVERRGYSVDKQYLVPLGEYMPLLYEWSLRALGMTEELAEMKRAFSYRAGPKDGQVDLSSHVPAIMFCFESLDAQGAWGLAREREVPFVAHPVSHAWFHEPRVLWHQLDAALKVQAVWSQVPIVSAANMATGALYTTRGEKVHPRVVGQGERWFVGEVSL